MRASVVEYKRHSRNQILRAQAIETICSWQRTSTDIEKTILGKRSIIRKNNQLTVNFKQLCVHLTVQAS